MILAEGIFTTDRAQAPHDDGLLLPAIVAIAERSHQRLHVNRTHTQGGHLVKVTLCFADDTITPQISLQVDMNQTNGNFFNILVYPPCYAQLRSFLQCDPIPRVMRHTVVAGLQVTYINRPADANFISGQVVAADGVQFAAAAAYFKRAVAHLLFLHEE